MGGREDASLGMSQRLPADASHGSRRLARQSAALHAASPTVAASHVIAPGLWQQQHLITMSTEGADTRSPSDFSCKEPGCQLKTFSTRSNLNRHNKSKHGQQVQMPCGKSLQNHASNSRRHKMSCRKCHAALVQPSITMERNNAGPPMNTTEITMFDLALETYPGGLDAIRYIMGDFYFEAP
ncbi:hypothetical protein CSIM01_00524 [Colletotrichum simmondsii]|uniref:C2H2-type domain-containing protein n=1 Tax=Colletotrichum simmondsii TaxID=703756 RepID=A0A135SIR4_9PEZI|nr:hypothetical protein CSIM01_00524 [Colletotrichum simmondsii]